MRNIVVVDIDGTLSVVGERRKYIAGEPKDWARFYADKFDDDPIPEVCDLVRELAKTYSILFCTSRSECARPKRRPRNATPYPSSWTIARLWPWRGKQRGIRAFM